jgi:hypothetical protein
MATLVHAGPAVRRSARRAWVLTSLQLVNVVWFGVCAWAALTQAASFSGLVYRPYRGDPYVQSAWPLWWRVFWSAVSITAILEAFIAPASLLVSAWLLAQKGTRSNRVLLPLALAGAVLTLAGLVLLISPAGRSVSVWIVD